MLKGAVKGAMRFVVVLRVAQEGLSEHAAGGVELLWRPHLVIRFVRSWLQDVVCFPELRLMGGY